MTKSHALTCTNGNKGELVLLARLGLAAIFLMAGLSGTHAAVVEFELQTNLANGRLWIDTTAGTVVDSDILVPYSRATPEFPHGDGMTNITGPLRVGVHGNGLSSYISFNFDSSFGKWETLYGNDPSWFEYVSISNNIALAFQKDALIGLNRNLEFVPFFDSPNAHYPEEFARTRRFGYAVNHYSGAYWTIDDGISGRLLIPEPHASFLQALSAVCFLGIVYRNRRSRR